MITEQKLDEMEAGLVGLSIGPWTRVEPGSGRTLVESQNGTVCEIAWNRADMGNAHRDAAHIARCDPVTIASLIELARIGLKHKDGIS